ncbi:glycoside hydrolase family 55 protein [Clostridium gasigenes]|uniref:glycoside hydrolase family 55 protein n=1 Tax=Clostridium gasigenes TaxID=94869 RepID=UPI001C0AF0D1|nr:glycoside hydrolase family 55 protein [Clostridium gasigenes]MBU3109905.1 glycoside hydrolase family 55 protein [Clostridium gasigenes]
MEFTNMNTIQMINKINKHEDDIVNTNMQLAEIKHYITPKMFGAKGDGITDDTISIQETFNNGGNIKFDASSKYLITNPIFVNKDNTIIDFCNADIIFNYDKTKPHSTNLDYRVNTMGIFNVKGVKSSYKSDIVLSSITNLKDGMIDIVNPERFSIGDYFVLVIIDKEESSSTNLGFKLYTLAKVIDKINSTLTISYKVSSDVWDLEYLKAKSVISKIEKVTPIKNVIIKNLLLNDLTTIARGWIPNAFDAYSMENSRHACCGIAHEYSDNLILENIKIKGTLFSGINGNAITNTVYKDINVSDTKLFGPGEGYCIQNASFNNISFDRIKGTNVRHTIDFSGGGYAKVNNIRSINTKSADIQFHGIFEHNIIINDVQGTKLDAITFNKPFINFGSGNQFGNANSNITIKNSDFYTYSDRNFQYTKKLLIVNSSVISKSPLLQVEYRNCVVEVFDIFDTVPTTRGTDLQTYLIINDSVFNINYVTTNYIINNYDLTKIKNTSIIYLKNKAEVNKYFSLEDIKKIELDNIDLEATIRPNTILLQRSDVTIKNSCLKNMYYGAIQLKYIKLTSEVNLILKTNLFTPFDGTTINNAPVYVETSILSTDIKINMILSGNINREKDLIILQNIKGFAGVRTSIIDNVGIVY